MQGDKNIQQDHITWEWFSSWIANFVRLCGYIQPQNILIKILILF